MCRTPGVARQCLLLVGVLLVCGSVRTAAADPPSGTVLIDGLSALAGGRDANESDSIPVLISDVELEAAFLLVFRQGPAGANSPVSEVLRHRARYRAVITRVLAQRAKRLDETADPKEIEALKKSFIDRAGGSVAVSQLLRRFGASEVDLDKWAENTLLAASQIRYAMEQTEDQGARALQTWLREVIAIAQARILR